MNKGFSPGARISRGGSSPLTILLSFITLGCVTLSGAYFLLLNKPAAPATGGFVSSDLELVDVLVPIDRIEPGTSLEPSLFRKESRPAISVGLNVIKDFDQLKGTFAASFIAAGQPLLSEYVTLRRPINQIEVTIPEGYRAVTMSVDNTTSVEGWARPGAKVDVVLASIINGRASVTLVVQNAKVLSAGRATKSTQQNMKNEDTGPSTVTLMVTVDEAAKIQLASSSGLLSLALRGDEDTIESPLNATTTIDSLLGNDTPSKPAVIPSEGRVKIDGREFVIINGKLVPEGKVSGSN